MSPSESDLRAALHDGEGDLPNVETLMVMAEARASQRRVRLMSTAAAVAIVASAGVGLGFLVSGGGHDQAGSSVAGLNGAPHSLRSSAAPAAGGAGNRYAYAAPACPAYGGQHAGEALATNLFSAPVRTVVVCSYEATPSSRPQPNGAAVPARVVLKGAQAEQLVRSLKNASTKRPKGMCPMVRTQPKPVVFVALGANEQVVGIATTDLGVPVCNVVVVINGGVRYNWTPPAELAPALASLAPAPLPVASPTH